MKNVGTARVRKPAGAQAALWAYAFVALLALFPPAMTDNLLPIALVYSLIGLYVAGLFVVDLLGKLDHDVMRSWIAAIAIVAVIISPTVCPQPVGARRGPAEDTRSMRPPGIPGSAISTSPPPRLPSAASAGCCCRSPAHGRVLDAGLSGHAVAEAVKRACRRAGLDAGEYSGHSMRAEAGDERCGDGVAELDVARTSRHKSVSTSRTYVREAQLFSRNAAAAVPWRELRARCSRCSATVRWAVALRASVTRTRIALGVLSWGLST